MKLIFKQEKLEDGFHYEYHVDEHGRKQGEMKVYYADENDENFKSNKIHAILNYKNSVMCGTQLAYDNTDFNFLITNFNEKGELHGETIFKNDDGSELKIILKNSERIDKNISQ